MSAANRVALGTAQLGQRYGITNQSGPPSASEVAAMLQLMRVAGSDTLDTAMSYGDSEAVLGAAGVRDFKVVTKLPALPPPPLDAGAWVRDRVRNSLDRLRVERLHGLLLHRPDDVSDARGAELLDALASLRAAGVVAKVGMSVYGPDELARLQPVVQPDIVQLPYNVLDRRFAESGWLERLHNRGTEVHVRSVFLQGLLLLDEARLPAEFSPWRPTWRRWCEWVRSQGLDNLGAALGFVLRNRNVARVVIGAETQGQLHQILVSATALERDAPAELASIDLNLINPVNWARK